MSGAAAEHRGLGKRDQSEADVGSAVRTADGRHLGVVAAIVAQGVVVDAGLRVYALPHAVLLRERRGFCLRLTMAELVARRSRVVAGSPR